MPFSSTGAIPLGARSERLSKYLQTTPAFTDAVAAAGCGFVAHRFAEEHPEHFRLRARESGAELGCGFTGETLRFDDGWRLVDAHPQPSPPYASALDALASQVAEDLAVVVRHADEGDEVCAIYLCAANHWAAEDKIGRSFFAVHAPVPGIDPINRNAYRMVRIMEGRGPFVRFVWGLATDTRLNHHPEPPPGIAAEAWRGRRFEAAAPSLFVRVERQVTWGFPEARASLFAIRNSFRDGQAVRADAALNAALCSALASMDAHQAQYKGVAHSREAILAWLRA